MIDDIFIRVENENTISLQDLLAVNTASASGIQPTESDAEVQFILQPTAETGPNAFSSFIFQDSNANITGQIISNHEVGVANIILESFDRPLLLNATNDSVVIQNITWPNVDGTTGQALITDGAGNLQWGASAAGNTESYTLVSSSGTTLNTGNRYMIVGNIAVNLPDYLSLVGGEAITISKQASATPTIFAFAGQTFDSDRGPANELVFDSTDELVFAYDGIAWQLQYTGVDVPVDLPTELTDLDDVTIANPLNGQVLQNNGTAWVNTQLDYSDLSGAPEVGNVKYEIPTNGQTLGINKSYFLNGDIAVTLPDYVPLSPGDNIRVAKAANLTPSINATAGQDIESDIGTNTSVLYDVTDEIVFVYNGTRWQLQYSGTSSLADIDAVSASSISTLVTSPIINISIKAMAEFQTKRRNGECKIFRSDNISGVVRKSPGIYQVIIEDKNIEGMNIGTESTAIIDLNFLTVEDDSSGWEVAGITKKAGNGSSYVTFKIVHILADGSRIVEEPSNNGYKNKILVRII